MPDLYRLTWDRWDEVDDLFDRALDVPEGDRERFLAEVCQDDRALLEAVRSLLSFDARVPSELDAPSRSLIRAALTEFRPSVAAGLEAGDSVGRYRVLSELGRGGMATVYEAERADGAFDRLVALKVLRKGLDTESLVRRFLSERQILSSLAHPNIATLLDGGATDDGRPFLVMELVRGETITTWADRHDLSVAARIELFLQVLDAVGFAHGHLVVHRDLKPSNVLVTENGQVKLLDFGVAKLLDATDEPGQELTQIAPAPMTPEFASPEQILGERVTTASDVFQLGALLYRLLSGSGPFSDPLARLRGTGLDATVVPPSNVVGTNERARAIRGDLDTIVLKALLPEPELRYGSADAMGADLRQHLGGQPITARPASPLYRLGKFSRRNPWFWPVAALLVLGFGGYLTTVVRYSNRLEVERNEALEQADRAEAIRGFMVNQFGAADPYSNEPASPDVTVVEAMAAGAESARRELADQPLLLAEMLSAIAWVYSNLSLNGSALDLLEEAMAIRTRNDADLSAEQIKDLGKFASLLGEQGQRDSARVLLLESLARERAMFGNDHPRTANVLELLGWHWFVDADYSPALEWYEEAARIRRSTEPVDAAALSATLAVLADSYRAVGRWDDAKQVATEAYEIALHEFGEEHTITAGNKGHLAQVFDGMGDTERAILLYRDALSVLERTLGPQHWQTLVYRNNLGVMLMTAGDLAGAEAVHRRLLERYLERYDTEPNRDVAATYQNLAVNVLRQGRYVEADSLARLAAQIYRERLGGDHFSVAYTLLTRSEALILQGRGSAAEDLAREAIAILQPQGESSYPSAAARCRLGRSLLLQGRLAEAEPVLRSGLVDLESNPNVPPREVRACDDALASLAQALGD